MVGVDDGCIGTIWCDCVLSVISCSKFSSLTPRGSGDVRERVGEVDGAARGDLRKEREGDQAHGSKVLLGERPREINTQVWVLIGSRLTRELEAEQASTAYPGGEAHGGGYGGG